MAERSMAFAHWNPHWNGVAFGVGAASAFALSAAGYGQIALALLAGLGAAGAVLFGAGHLNLKPEGGSDERIHRLFGALPAAVNWRLAAPDRLSGLRHVTTPAATMVRATAW